MAISLALPPFLIHTLSFTSPISVSTSLSLAPVYRSPTYCTCRSRKTQLQQWQCSPPPPPAMHVRYKFCRTNAKRFHDTLLRIQHYVDKQQLAARHTTLFVIFDLIKWIIGTAPFALFCPPSSYKSVCPSMQSMFIIISFNISIINLPLRVDGIECGAIHNTNFNCHFLHSNSAWNFEFS